MKNNSVILNPSKQIAGLPAFGVGLVFMMATGLVGHFSNTVFIGNLQMKLVTGVPLANAFAVQGISLAVTVGVMYLSVLALCRNISFIDLLGGVTLARYPFLLAAIPGFFVNLTPPEELRESIFANSFYFGEIAGIVVAGFCMLAVAAFAVFLLYRAYAVSSGLKGPKLFWSFTAALVISEIITGILASCFI